MADTRMDAAIRKEVEELDDETRPRHLRAVGFTEAGLTRLARRELDALPAAAQQLICVLALRLDLAQRDARWEEALGLAAALVVSFPETSHLRIAQAYAARRCRSLEEAEAILVRMVKDFPEEGLPHYNLACYAAARGEAELAKARLRKAIEFADGYISLAVDDEDLACIRDWVISLESERWPDK